MSYYEPSSLYGLEASLGERSRWDSGVHSDYSELWGLAGPCQDCKITIPELKQKLEMVKQEKVYLEAQKGFLHAQLDNSLTMTSSLEAEITGLRSELRDRDAENADLRSRLTRLENEVSLKPEVPPPPPPPPPPKSLFSHIKNNIKIRKSKRAASVPNINSSSATGSSPMKLNNDTLDAIKNRRYQLRPVRRNSVQKKRRLSESAWDVRDVGMGDIAQILSRRISMGYSTIEEDTVSVKSFNSIRSSGSLESLDWKMTDMNINKPLYVTVLQID